MWNFSHENKYTSHQIFKRDFCEKFYKTFYFLSLYPRFPLQTKK